MGGSGKLKILGNLDISRKSRFQIPSQIHNKWLLVMIKHEKRQTNCYAYFLTVIHCYAGFSSFLCLVI